MGCCETPNIVDGKCLCCGAIHEEKRMNCELCGEPMPKGEEMFKYHGYSGPCPKPPLPLSVTVRGVTRRWINTLEIIFSRPITDDEHINTWLYLKEFVPKPQRPEGWDPADKRNPSDWCKVVDFPAAQTPKEN